MKPSLNSCNPVIIIACILSCILCTIVVIWGVYTVHADIANIRMMMTPVSSSPVSIDPMVAHCQTMPEMAGCEKYR